MKIAFDAKRATHNSTGLGNYSRYIIRILTKYYPQHSYLLYTPEKGKKRLLEPYTGNQNVIIKYPKSFLGRMMKKLWRFVGILSDLKKDKPGIYHGLTNELPKGINRQGIPSVVTIHDLIFLRYPQFYKTIDCKIYYYKFKNACINADRIIAISEMTKKDIISFFNISENKIDVIYQGCDPAFASEVAADIKNTVKTKYNLPEKYILYVGSIEERKNLLLIIRALQQTKNKIHLIAIGRRTVYAKTVEKFIFENNLTNQVTILEGIDFQELPAFYQMASLFIYPSFFEGFGIPIIEALYSGVPVISATGSCLEEAGGPSSIYVNPTDINDLSHQIDFVLSNPLVACKMINDGKEYVNKFNDETIAKQLMNIYTDVLKMKREDG